MHLYLKILCNHGPLYKPFCSPAKLLTHLNTRVCHPRFSPSLLNTAALNLPFHSSAGHSGLRLPLWLIHCAECALAHLNVELNIFKWGDPFFWIQLQGLSWSLGGSVGGTKKNPPWSCQTSNDNKHRKVMYKHYMHDCVGPHVMFTCGRLLIWLLANCEQVILVSFKYC